MIPLWIRVWILLVCVTYLVTRIFEAQLMGLIVDLRSMAHSGMATSRSMRVLESAESALENNRSIKLLELVFGFPLLLPVTLFAIIWTEMMRPRL